MIVLNEIIMLGGMFLVTFGIRYALLARAKHYELPEIWRSALKYVPPSVLTAITVPLLVKPSGEWDLSFSNSYLIGGIAAVFFGLIFRKHTLIAAIGGGLTVFFIWRLVILA